MTNIFSSLLKVLNIKFNKSKKNKELSPDPLQNLTERYDDMTCRTFFRHVTSAQSVNRNDVFLKFSKTESGKFDIHLVMQREVSYVESRGYGKPHTVFARADGKFIDLSDMYKSWTRSYGNYVPFNAHRRFDLSTIPLASPEIRKIVTDLSQAEHVKIRFEGFDFYEDIELTNIQLRAMRDIIAAYEIFTGKKWE